MADDGVDTGWRSALRDTDAALDYLYCLLRAQRWVHRRVDELNFFGTGTVHQRTEIDLTVPVGAPLFHLGKQPVTVLPIVPVVKGTLVNFDIRDGEDRQLPTLNYSQNSAIVIRGMLGLAERVLADEGIMVDLLRDYAEDDDATGRTLRHAARRLALNRANGSSARARGGAGWIRPALADVLAVQRSIIELVTAPLPDADRYLAEFGTPAARPTPLHGLLWDTVSYRVFLRQFAFTYYVAAVLRDDRRNEPHVMIFTFDRRRESANIANRPILRRFPTRELLTTRFWRDAGVLAKDFVVAGLETLGWIPMAVAVDANAAVDAESYHLELQAPLGLKITDCEWYITPPRANRVVQPDEEQRGRAQIRADLGEYPVSASSDFRAGEEPRRLRTTITSVPLGYSLWVRFHMAPVSTGWLLMAVPATLLAMIALIFEIRNPIAAGSESGSLLENRMTLLLGVLAVIGSALLPHGENPLTRRLLFVPRVATVSLLGVLLIDAFSLTVDQSAPGDWALVAGLAEWSWVFALGACVAVAIPQLVAFGPVRRLARVIGRRKHASWRFWDGR